jgi:hypothetical protein
MSQHDGRPWEGEGDLPWDTPDTEWEPSDGEPWRGDIHMDDWPESLAGPEYWLYKNQGDGDDDAQEAA